MQYLGQNNYELSHYSNQGIYKYIKILKSILFWIDVRLENLKYFLKAHFFEKVYYESKSNVYMYKSSALIFRIC